MTKNKRDARGSEDGRRRENLVRGDDTVGDPHRAQISQAFRAYPLIEIRQTILYRAIRGNRISVNSTLPPS